MSVIVAVNAIGKHVYPMLIFPRVDFKDHILSGALTASIRSANPAHWSNEKLFSEYLKHIITCRKPLRKAQLILKNRESKLAIPAVDIQGKWHFLAYSATPYITQTTGILQHLWSIHCLP